MRVVAAVFQTLTWVKPRTGAPFLAQTYSDDILSASFLVGISHCIGISALACCIHEKGCHYLKNSDSENR